jgi:hypothetical protein
MKFHRSAFGVAACLAVFMVVFVPAEGVHAQTVQGFESGLPPGSTIGDAGIRTTNYFGITPTEGNNMLLITTIHNKNDSPTVNQSGMNADAPANVAFFLGYNESNIRNTRPGTLPSDTIREGSAFELNLGPINAGFVITFDYNFLTSEPGPARDFAFITLTGQSGDVPIVADIFDAGTAFGGGSPFNLQSGFQTYSINISTAGTYTLGIGIADARNLEGPSGLLIDNISIIPEPSSIMLGVAGAVFLVALRRRVRKSKA